MKIIPDPIGKDGRFVEPTASDLEGATPEQLTAIEALRTASKMEADAEAAIKNAQTRIADMVQEIGRIEHYNKIVAPKVTAIDAARAWIKSQREQQNAF